MAKYRVWYRAGEIGPGQYIAVVTCVPDGSGHEGSPPMESECRLFRDRQSATEACAAMAAAIAERVIRRGDEITKTQGV